MRSERATPCLLRNQNPPASTVVTTAIKIHHRRGLDVVAMVEREMMRALRADPLRPIEPILPYRPERRSSLDHYLKSQVKPSVDPTPPQSVPGLPTAEYSPGA